MKENIQFFNSNFKSVLLWHRNMASHKESDAEDRNICQQIPAKDSPHSVATECNQPGTTSPNVKSKKKFRHKWGSLDWPYCLKHCTSFDVESTWEVEGLGTWQRDVLVDIRLMGYTRNEIENLPKTVEVGGSFIDGLCSVKSEL
jgi:hypothetical protein